MATSRMFSLRICASLVVCLAGLSYWLYWHYEIGSARISSYWFSFEGKNRSNSSCLEELQLAFGIKEVSLASPTYVRLPQPVPISGACVSLFANSTAALANFIMPNRFSQDDQERIYQIVHRLLGNFTQRNLELFLVGGSLIGSVRHFGFFPWDADADVMIPANQKAKSRDLLIDMTDSDELLFLDTERINGHWQLGILCRAMRNMTFKRLYGRNKLYPEKKCKTIVDFFFGWVAGKLYRRLEYPYSFPVGDVYPLRLRPYGPYLIPAPRNPSNFLAAVYGKDFETNCYFKYYGGKKISCAPLRSINPFVSHLRIPYNDTLVQIDVLVYEGNMLSLFIPQQM